MANVTIWVNTTNTDAGVGNSGTDWLEFSPGNDKLIFTGGSVQVADGQDTPTQQELISAGIVLTGSQIVVDDYLFLDADMDELYSIPLMGNQDTQYVLGFEFDDATASEPVLEIWDDNTFATIDSAMLGSGVASNSFVRGITTTYASPGTNWTGSRLAGSGAGNFLYLNDGNGALSAADILYANLKVIIPASQTTGFSATPVFCVKFLSN